MTPVRRIHQERGARTADKFGQAALRLMRTRRLDDVAVTDIVSEAGMSVGAFYARFTSKHALLDWLCTRQLGRATTNIVEDLRSLERRGAGLRRIVEAYVNHAADFFQDNAALLRDVVLVGSRGHDGGILPATREASRTADDVVIEILRAVDPGQRRRTAADYSFVTAFVACMLRAYLLFPDTLPPLERRRSLASVKRELSAWILGRLREGED